MGNKTTTIITKTMMTRSPNSFFEFRDEFPGTKTLSEVLDYIFRCKINIMKDTESKYTIQNINISRKETITL